MAQRTPQFSSQLAPKAPILNLDARAISVTFDEGTFRVQLADGREIATPIAWFPRLASGTPEQLRKWKLIGRGYGIHWEELDEDLSVKGLLRYE